jgi:two-component system response regulator DesR
VLAAPGADRPVRDVARALFLSHGTVRNYLAAATLKLGARNRTEAYRLAQDNGWI